MFPVIDVIRKYIDKNNLLKRDGRYLVALSGGADSVSLLRILIELGYSVEAAHCNFHLRGEESDGDEAFCRELCNRMNVPIHVAHFDTHSYAELHHVSIEMAARDLRYNYFHQLLSDLSLDAVCVAHHRDDSVETVLLNMLRGTGIDGLKGIAPKNKNIIRPLLCVTRSNLIDYLQGIKQDYRTDSSNLVADVQRNKIRLDILPRLMEVNASACDNIAHMTENIQDVIPLIEYAIEDIRKKVVIKDDGDNFVLSIPQLRNMPSLVSVLWYLLRDDGFTSRQVEQIAENLDAQSGKMWSSAKYDVLIDRETIVVKAKSLDEEKTLLIPECGKYIYNNDKYFAIQKCRLYDVKAMLLEPINAVLDASKPRFPLTVRRVREGDWFIPFGMKGRKLLSDFMTDRKMNLFEKHSQMVVEDADRNIVWVVDKRPDARFCVTDTTTEVYVITHN